MWALGTFAYGDWRALGDLRAGDVMDCEITGLGAQRNRCVTGG